jgi:hypothetical protein
VGDSGLKFARDFDRVWFPFGTDEQLFRIPGFIVLMSKKHFCVNIMDEAFASILKFFRAVCRGVRQKLRPSPRRAECFLGGVLKVQRLWQDRLEGREESTIDGVSSNLMARLWFFDFSGSATNP